MKSSHTNFSDAISLIEEYVTHGYGSFKLYKEGCMWYIEVK